ncbi:hypothetical protein ABIB57_001995 [Devosia sp. UYZn731]|uniref:hypothetical protein n=1 Tax=Devosia sp. UYZn731 TaxID=3156345 RepID=UPI0033980463
MDDTADLDVSIENDDEPAAPAQDFELLSVCPDDEAARTPWRKALWTWRENARHTLAYDGSRYHAEPAAWTQTAFVCGLVMLWEEGFYNPATREFTVDRFLDQAEKAFGGSTC